MGTIDSAYELVVACGGYRDCQLEKKTNKGGLRKWLISHGGAMN